MSVYESPRVAGRVHALVRPPHSGGLKPPAYQPAAFRRSNARINRARIQRIKHPILRMKAALFALRFNELLCWSAPFRRAKRHLIFILLCDS
jgi:hypothetical protein